MTQKRFTREQFLQELQGLLQRDDPIAFDAYLWDLEEWDSLAIVVCMAWFDKIFGVQTKFNQLKDLDTPAQLAALAGGAIGE